MVVPGRWGLPAPSRRVRWSLASSIEVFLTGFLYLRWHKLRASEYEFDRELKEKRMMALTSQEREIRKQLEDALSLPEHSPIVSVAPAIALNGHSSTNGAKPKQNGTSGKKGKQKK